MILMDIVTYTQTNNNVNVMMFNLTQEEIETLDQHEYSLFLAYGDTLTDQTTVSIGEGSHQLWEDEASRLIEEARGEILCLGKRVRSQFNSYGTTFSDQRDRINQEKAT